MPLIYKIIRGDGTQDEKLPKGAAGAVLHDSEGEGEGEQVSAYLALFREGQWIVIRHPIEDSDLKGNGETYESAQAKGLLFLVSPYICLTCGATVDIPDLRYSFAGGCIGPILIGIALATVLIVTEATSPILGIISGYLGMILAALIWTFCADLVKRRKFSDILKAAAKDSCDQCGGSDIRNVAKAGRKKIVLKNGKSIQVKTVGIS